MRGALRMAFLSDACPDGCWTSWGVGLAQFVEGY